MSERYTRLFSLSDELYAKGSPVTIAAGALLKDTVTGKILTQLKLRNIGLKKIKAAVVRISPLDAAEKPLGKAFEHQYLDLSVGRDQEFAQKVPVWMPDPNARGFSVVVTRVIYEDNDEWQSEGACWEPLVVPALLGEVLNDRELVSEYCRQYGSDSKYFPGEYEDLWYCSCGTMNRREEEVCRKCGKSLAAFLAFDLAELTARKEARLARQAEEERIARENLRKAEEERRKKEEEEAEAAAIAAKKRRKRNAIIAAVLVPVLLIAAAVAAIILTKPARVLSDAEEMAAAGDYMAAVAVLDEYGHPDKTGTARQGYLDAMEQEIKAMIDRKDFPAALELIDRYAVLDTKGENIRTIQKLCGHDLKDSGHADHTCTKDGYTHRTCAVCGWVEEIIHPALGHQYVLETTNPSTCSEQGSEVFACSVCGDNYTEMLELLPHEYESSVTKAATCTEEGVRTNTCTGCGHTTEEAVPLVEHENIDTVTKAATCTEIGVRTISCTVCGESSEESIPMVAHKNKETVTKAATCTETGVRTISCTVCGKTSQESIPTIPHSNKDTIVREATCTQEGQKNSVCTVCGTVANSVLISKTDHSFQEAVAREATCTKVGVKNTVCSACGLVADSVDIPMVEHDYQETVVQKATCTKVGVKRMVCTVCKGTAKETTIPAIGHSYKVSSTTPASCTETGVNQYTCEYCKDSYSVTIRATGHDWIYATCVAPDICINCGETRDEAQGHDWDLVDYYNPYSVECNRCDEVYEPNQNAQITTNLPVTNEKTEYKWIWGKGMPQVKTEVTVTELNCTLTMFTVGEKAGIKFNIELKGTMNIEKEDDGSDSIVFDVVLYDSSGKVLGKIRLFPSGKESTGVSDDGVIAVDDYMPESDESFYFEVIPVEWV